MHDKKSKDEVELLSLLHKFDCFTTNATHQMSLKIAERSHSRNYVTNHVFHELVKNMIRKNATWWLVANLYMYKSIYMKFPFGYKPIIVLYPPKSINKDTGHIASQLQGGSAAQQQGSILCELP